MEFNENLVAENEERMSCLYEPGGFYEAAIAEPRVGRGGRSEAAQLSKYHRGGRYNGLRRRGYYANVM